MDYTKVVFCFKGKEIPITETYRIKKYYDGFGDQQSIILDEILSLVFNNKNDIDD